MPRTRAFTLAELVTSLVLGLFLLGFTQAIIGCGGGGNSGLSTEELRKATDELRDAVGHLKKSAGELRETTELFEPIAEELRQLQAVEERYKQGKLGPPEVDSNNPSVRRNARQMQNSTQVRGIIQGMVNYAPGNNEWYPGLTSKGKEDQTVLEPSQRSYGVKGKTGYDPAFRVALMIRNSYFTPDYAVSPLETNPDIKPASLSKGGEITASNFSFAMLELSSGKARNVEWASTTNSKAAVVSDRNIGTDAANGARSNAGAGQGWRGSVGFNDNHVMFETTHILRDLQYGQSNAEVPMDNLFISGDRLETPVPADFHADAMMTFKSPSDGGTNQNP